MFYRQLRSKSDYSHRYVLSCNSCPLRHERYQLCRCKNIFFKCSFRMPFMSTCNSSTEMRNSVQELERMNHLQLFFEGVFLCNKRLLLEIYITSFLWFFFVFVFYPTVLISI